MRNWEAKKGLDGRMQTVGVSDKFGHGWVWIEGA